MISFRTARRGTLLRRPEKRLMASDAALPTRTRAVRDDTAHTSHREGRNDALGCVVESWRVTEDRSLGSDRLSTSARSRRLSPAVQVTHPPFPKPSFSINATDCPQVFPRCKGRELPRVLP